MTLYSSRLLLLAVLLVLHFPCSFAQPFLSFGSRTLAGGSIAGSLDGVGTTAQFSSPWGGVYDTDGTLLISDSANHVIRRVNPTTGVVTLVAGLYRPSFFDGPALGGTGVGQGPYATTTDGAGRGFWAESNGNIRFVFLANHTCYTFALLPSFFLSTLAWDGSLAGGVPGGSLVTVSTAAGAQPYIILRVLMNGTFYPLAGLAGSAGRADGVGTSASLTAVTSLVVDGTKGTLWLSDSHAIRMGVPTLSPPSPLPLYNISTIAGSMGTPGYADSATNGTLAPSTLAPTPPMPWP